MMTRYTNKKIYLVCQLANEKFLDTKKYQKMISHYIIKSFFTVTTVSQ